MLPATGCTVWNPGVAGRHPGRTTVCATVNASARQRRLRRPPIQAAIDACPAGQVVQLSAGTFTINGGNYLLINKGITLRGAGPGQTTLQKTDGAKPGQEQTGANPSPLVIIGPARWDSNNERSTNLERRRGQGRHPSPWPAPPASAPGRSCSSTSSRAPAGSPTRRAGDRSGPRPTSASSGSATTRARAPTIPSRMPPAGSAGRTDPTNEVKQIDHISGNTIFFNTPIHISYRTSHTAQLTAFSYPHTQNAGRRGPDGHRR